MDQQNFGLGQPFAGRYSIEDIVCQTYNNVRKIDGSLGRDAFMRACHAYETSRPDVPDNVVPKKVVELLNPGLKANSAGMLPTAARIN